MSEPFIGEIRMFAGNFAPQGWAFCDGQLLAVNQNDALFSLFGTIYGGDGETTFGLPDLRGRIPIHAGSGPGLTPRQLGARGGAENVTVTEQQLPNHTHQPRATENTDVTTEPTGRVVGQPAKNIYRSPPDNGLDTSTDSIVPVGGSNQHTNIQPFLCVHFIVALFGIYPSTT